MIPTAATGLTVIKESRERSGAGHLHVVLITECGQARSMAEWAALLKRPRQELYSRYRKYRGDIPTNKILVPERRPHRDDLDIWNKYQALGRDPKRVVKKIKARTGRGHSCNLLQCDNGYIYEVADLAKLVGMAASTLRGRIPKWGHDHPHLLKKIKDGCDKNGRRIIRKKKQHAKSQTSEFSSLSDKKKSFLLKPNTKYDDMFFPSR